MVKKLSPEEIKELRQKLGLTQEEFGRLLGVGFATVNRWENGKAEPKGPVEEVLWKLKLLLEEAEKGRGFTLDDIVKIIQGLLTGSTINQLARFLPLGLVGLMAPIGLFSFITALTSSLFLKKLFENKNSQNEEE